MSGPALDVVINRAWLRRFAHQTRLMTLDLVPDEVSTCILTTRVGHEVLTRFGVRSTPRATTVKVETASAYRLTADGVPVSEWPADAWSVGVDPRLPAADRRWNAHLVLVVRATEAMLAEPDAAPRIFVDLTADQFSRPAKGLTVGGPIIFGIRSDQAWTPHDSLGSLVTGSGDDEPGLASYWPLAPGMPQSKNYRDTPGWNPDEGWLSDVVDALVERLSAPETPT